MKTQHNNQEREISQVCKMVLFSSAIALGVLSISMAASAQDFWKQFSGDNSYGKMTSLLVVESFETENIDAVFEIIDAEISAKLNHSNVFFIYEPEMEETLEIENWMTEESFFTSTVDFTSVEAEENLEIENWMTNEALFANSASLTAIETDEALNVEEWMTSDYNFNNQAALVATGSEPALQVQAWMINEDYFLAGEF